MKTAQYWLARYVNDVFRGEAANIGVFVKLSDGSLAARFVGEGDDCSVDGRKLTRFSDSSAYRQWVAFWRDEIGQGNIDFIVRSQSANFVVEPAGRLTDVDDNDHPNEVCLYLFNWLVAGGPLDGALGLDRRVAEDTVADTPDLSDSVKETFAHLRLLGAETELLVRHPIVMDRQIPGKHTAHMPTFSQQNGHLAIFETVDFTKRNRLVKDRAGWVAYMFSDVREFDQSAETVAIVRDLDGHGNGFLDYARSMLKSEGTIVNWSDEMDRGRFLEARKAVAN